MAKKLRPVVIELSDDDWLDGKRLSISSVSGDA